MWIADRSFYCSGVNACFGFVGALTGGETVDRASVRISPTMLCFHSSLVVSALRGVGNFVAKWDTLLFLKHTPTVYFQEIMCMGM